MGAGRPQEWDIDFLTNELLIWARLPNSLNINGFCISLVPEIDPEYFRALVRKHAKLSQAFRIAKAHLAIRREEANSEKLLSDKAFMINAKHYDIFLRDFDKEEDQEMLVFQSKLKKEENESSSNATAEIISQAMKLTSNIKQ